MSDIINQFVTLVLSVIYEPLQMVGMDLKEIDLTIYDTEINLYQMLYFMINVAVVVVMIIYTFKLINTLWRKVFRLE